MGPGLYSAPVACRAVGVALILLIICRPSALSNWLAFRFFCIFFVDGYTNRRSINSPPKHYETFRFTVRGSEGKS